MQPVIIGQQVTRSSRVMILPRAGAGATWMKCSSTWETTRHRRTDKSHVITRWCVLRLKKGLRRRVRRLESSMNQVQVEQKSYQMPPQDGFTVAHFLTVADIERSARFYETVFGGRILSRGDSSGAPGYIQIANTSLIVNVGGGPTPDKPSVTLSVPADPDSVSSFMNIRVADIQACYQLYPIPAAHFIPHPK